MTYYLCFDTETTSVDPLTGRIVQAFLGLMDPTTGDWVPGCTMEFVLNPQVPVPEGAAAVHGYTTERLQTEGRTDIGACLEQIAGAIRFHANRGDYLVIMNAPFDTTFLNAELERHGLLPIDYSGTGAPTVIDPYVLDKALDKYRRGSRKLVDLAAHYGVPVEENAHDAAADCLMTGRIAARILAHPSLATRPAGYLTNYQRRAKAEQSASFQNYLRTKAPADKRDPNAVIDGSWPIRLKESAA